MASMITLGEENKGPAVKRIRAPSTYLLLLVYCYTEARDFSPPNLIDELQVVCDRLSRSLERCKNANRIRQDLLHLIPSTRTPYLRCRFLSQKHLCFANWREIFSLRTELIWENLTDLCRKTHD